MFDRLRATSSDSPRSPLDTPAGSLGELVPPGSSPVAPKSPDTERSSFPLRVDGNEMSLEEEQLANASDKSKRNYSLEIILCVSFVSGLHNFREFSQPLSCLYQAMQTQEKKFAIAFIK